MLWQDEALRVYPMGPAMSGPEEPERQARQSRHSGFGDVCVT